uniref:STAS domain-containing protein n=1 Tax=Lotharella globosa TaxID=91324 RepID=A0A7S3YPH5_9EUKA
METVGEPPAAERGSEGSAHTHGSSIDTQGLKNRGLFDAIQSGKGTMGGLDAHDAHHPTDTKGLQLKMIKRQMDKKSKNDAKKKTKMLLQRGSLSRGDKTMFGSTHTSTGSYDGKSGLKDVHSGGHHKSHGDDHHHHHHHYGDHKCHSVTVSVVSGLILGMFMYVTCSVFGILMFETDPRLQEFDMYGTYMALIAFIIGGAITTTWSKCQIIISGPDINPILFLIEAALVITEVIPDVSGEDTTPELLATVVFTVIYATLIVAILFYCIGRFKVTNFVQYMPQAVLNGFLASVGVLIIKEAIVVATGYHWKEKYLKQMWTTWDSWKLILPALPIGIPLYFLKRNHVLHPAILIPIFLCVPLIIFYIVLAATGTSIDEARDQGWFFHYLEPKPFYEDWGAIWLNLDKIDWNAFNRAQPTIWVMQVVVIMDTLVKLTNIEKVYNQNLDFDKEVELMGIANAAGFLGIAVPTYGLTGFTALNKATIHRMDDRIPGYVAVVFCGIFYFVGFPLMNYIPRFLASGLILYKGIGVLWENIVDARHRLGKLELLAVLGIVLLAYFQGLVLAVIIGIVISSVIFVVQYARRYDIKNRWTLRTYHSSIVRRYLERQKLHQFGDKMMGFQLTGYLFFGSAVRILRLLSDELAGNTLKPKHKRITHVVLDFESVDGMDAAAAAIFLKIQRMLKDMGVVVFWSPFLTPEKVKRREENEKRLRTGGEATRIVTTDATGEEKSMLPKDDVVNLSKERLRKRLTQDGVNLDLAFETFDHAVEAVEEAVLEEAQAIRSKWFIIPSMIKMHCLASHTVSAGQFQELLSETRIAKFCDEEIKHKDEILFTMGDELEKVWLLHSGKVQLTVKKYRKDNKIKTPCAVEERISVFKTGVVSQTLPGLLCSETAKCLATSSFITINKQQLHNLTEKYPQDALKLQRLIITDIAESKSQLEHKHQGSDSLGEDEYIKEKVHKEEETKNTCNFTRMNSQRLVDKMSKETRKRARSRSKSSLLQIPGTTSIAQRLSNTKRSIVTKNNANLPQMHLPTEPPKLTSDNSKKFLPVASPLLVLARKKTKELEDVPKPVRGSINSHNDSGIFTRMETQRVPERVHSDRTSDRGSNSVDLLPVDEGLITLTGTQKMATPEEELDVHCPYILSRHQKFTFTQIFKNLSEHAPTWAGLSKERKLAANLLRHAIFDCGYYLTSREIEIIKKRLDLHGLKAINLLQFLTFMKRISLAELSDGYRQEYHATFCRFAKKPKLGLRVPELIELMTEQDAFKESFVADDADNIIDQWGDTKMKTLNFRQFISMMAFSHMTNRLERQVESRAFHEFAKKGTNRITKKDIQECIKRITNYKMSDEEATEMLWEADVGKKQYLNKHDFLQVSSKRKKQKKKNAKTQK